MFFLARLFVIAVVTVFSQVCRPPPTLSSVSTTADMYVRWKISKLSSHFISFNQVDVKDDKGCTPCLMAALNGHLGAVELLLDRFKSKVSSALARFPCLCFSILLRVSGVLACVECRVSLSWLPVVSLLLG